MFHSFRRFMLVTIGVLGLAVVAWQCTDSTTQPTARVAIATGGKRAAVTQQAVDRAAAARERTKWAAEEHHRVVRRLVAARKQLKRDRTHAENCAIAWDVIREELPRFSAAGFAITPALAEAARRGAAVGACAGGEGISAYINATSASALSIFNAVALRQQTTGAFANYEGALDAIYNASYWPWEVASAANSVVAQAAADGIPQADLDVVAGVANVAISSAYDWYTYERNGGFRGVDCTTTCDVALMSVFLQKGSAWRRVGYADLGGAISGALRAGFQGAVIGGALSSAISALGLM